MHISPTSFSLALCLAATAWAQQDSGQQGATPQMTISSSAFQEGQEMPGKYTCEGTNTSPPISWSNVPAKAVSLALIADDPDAPDPAAPKMTFVHWVIYDVPVSAKGLPEGVKSKSLPPGTREGKNGRGKPGYTGPCPPIGRHRYFFKLFALDTVLSDQKQPSSEQLQKAMEGHVLAKAQTIGTYQKQKK